MARQHVFPLCSPTLKITEVTGVLGEEKPWKENANVFYFQDGEDDVQIVVRGPGQVGDGTLYSVHVAIKSFVGEYLINYPGEISTPAGPLTGDGRIQLPNYPLDFFSSYESRGVIRDPDPGSLICIGVKLYDSAKNLTLMAISEVPAPLYISQPFQGNFKTDMTVNEENKNSWTTLMWTGTRWVILGSNNWY